MKKFSQKEIILNLLKESPGNWFPSYSLLKASTRWGWIGSQGDRRARELAEEGKIVVRHQGKYAEYKCKEPETSIYRPEVMRQKLQPSLSF